MHACHAELGPQGTLHPKSLFDEVRNPITILPDQLLQVGAFAQHAEREGEQAHRGLLASREEVGGDERGVLDVGSGSVWEPRRGETGQNVIAGMLAAVLDVLHEPLVEELERLVFELLVNSREALPEE